MNSPISSVSLPHRLSLPHCSQFGDFWLEMDMLDGTLRLPSFGTVFTMLNYAKMLKFQRFFRPKIELSGWHCRGLACQKSIKHFGRNQGRNSIGLEGGWPSTHQHVVQGGQLTLLSTFDILWLLQLQVKSSMRYPNLLNMSTSLMGSPVTLGSSCGAFHAPSTMEVFAPTFWRLDVCIGIGP